ncbi:MAG TPA: GNAT family N-acetyltransferase [Puia sp.]|nr:GNAT family N-acetyltransferase [Puia sp.]
MTNTNSITVRKANARDDQLLCSICRLSYSENFAGHWNEGGLNWYLEKVYSLEGIGLDLSDPEINYFIAFAGEEPVGFMKLFLDSPLPGHPLTKGVEIEKIYFRPRFQGMGIGKKLIGLALEIGKRMGKELIWLGVIDSNENAIAFYKKMGFHIHDKTRLDIPYFKEELKGMLRMRLNIGS